MHMWRFYYFTFHTFTADAPLSLTVRLGQKICLADSDGSDHHLPVTESELIAMDSLYIKQHPNCQDAGF